MKKYHNKIKGLTLQQITRKIIRRILNEIIWFYQDFKTVMCYRKFNAVNNYKSQMINFFITDLTESHMEEIKKLELDKKVLSKADEICLHEFDILGSGNFQLGSKIDWNTDFKSNYTWDRKFHKRIKTIDYFNNADVKVPWELSRFYFGVVLGQAYSISDNRKYYDEFKSLVKDWIRSNGFNKSVNWTCSMEVAIRACNWIVTLGYFENIIEDDLLDEINNSLFLHGKYIFNNLEKEVVSNNHYLSNLVGLLWIGIYFSSYSRSTEPSKWLEYAINELEKEILVQVYDDGSSYEGSTYYHCFVTEMMLFTYIMCEQNALKLSDQFKSRLIKMCEVVMNITKPNGLIPLIGDMDSGRFLMFSHYSESEKRDFKFLVRLAGEYFKREDFRYNANDLSTVIWLKVNINKDIPNRIELKSISYSFGGWHILRNEKLFVIISCRNFNVKGSGGHIHNDQLSLEINIMGYDVIIDPGTYVYTADFKMRNFFRSSNQHNSVIVANTEQVEFDEYKLFNTPDKTKPKAIEFNSNYFRGCHSAYKENFGCEICREVTLNEHSIIITDRIIKKELNDLNNSISFIFDDMITFNTEKILLPNGNSIKIISSHELFRDSNIEDTFVSKKYGQKSKSAKLNLSFNEDCFRLEMQF